MYIPGGIGCDQHRRSQKQVIFESAFCRLGGLKGVLSAKAQACATHGTSELFHESSCRQEPEFGEAQYFLVPIERAKAGSAPKNGLDFPVAFSTCKIGGISSHPRPEGRPCTRYVVRIAT